MGYGQPGGLKKCICSRFQIRSLVSRSLIKFTEKGISTNSFQYNYIIKKEPSNTKKTIVSQNIFRRC